MLKPEEMCRVSIVGSKSAMKHTIDALHKLGVLHIEDFYADREKALSEKFGLMLGSPLEESEGISSSLVMLRAMQSRLPPLKEGGASARIHEITHGQINALESEISGASERLKDIEDERARISAAIREIEIFEGLDIDFRHLRDYKSLSVFAGYVTLDSKNTEDAVRKSLEKVSPKCRLYFWQHGARRAVMVFSKPEKKDEMQKALSGFGYSEINLANIKSLSGTAKENLHGLRAKEAELKKARESENLKLAEISRTWLGAFRKKENELVSESERASAPLKFATTKSTFIADGWVPASKYQAMQESVEHAAKGRVYMERYETDEEAPVRLEHPKIVEPFEFFMNLYSLPRYKEIDPTFFMFLTFPLFFGMMLGDIGYGIVTTLLFITLRRKLAGPEIRALLNVMIFASVASIIFGFVFGEFFGEEAIFGIELPRLLNRVEGINEMLLITAGIGVAQLNLGFLLGFYNKLKEHGFVHALLEKGSWFVVEAGIALIAASYLGYLSVSYYIGGALFFIGLLTLLKGEGIKGVVELPALLSNTLSYTRLMAVGLASVSLALVVNEVAGGLFHQGGLYIFIALIILILGHAVNLALGILGPFLHSLRLHYVEFFTKFFEGGGKRYRPFGE